jgi:hypothetical protein
LELLTGLELLGFLELLLAALEAALELVGAALADSVAFSPPQAARPKVMRAAMAAKILTFFIVFLATIMVASSFLSGFLVFRRWRSP